MASLGHVAVGMAAGRAWAGTRARRAMLGLAALSLLPDADVVGMAAGVPYGAPWGHRGATHSIAMAALVAVLVAAAAGGAFHVKARRALALGALCFAVTASHGVLDAMTDGGRGVALLWPVSTRRFFLPWRPIPVAPIGMGILSEEGLGVLLWELAVFLPLLAYALWPRGRRD